MSLVFDAEKAFTYIYHYTNGAYDTTNYATSASFDLFTDTAQVGDYILFGKREPSWNFHDLKFNVGTALSATSITVVWEYLKNGVWTAIPNITDGTNNFQNTGINTVAFDVPEYMCASGTGWYTRYNIGGYKYGIWVRARITEVSGITEGGATQNDTVKMKDHTITAINETMTLSALQTASDSGNWLSRTGEKAVETIGEYTIIRTHLQMSGTTTWAETKKMIELGESNYPVGWRNSGGVIQFGIRDANGTGDEGCYLYQHARFASGYDYVANLQCYATTIRRRTGQYGAIALRGVFKFVDSVWISDSKWYVSSAVSAGSEWTRSLYADPDLLYIYTPNLAIDTFKWQNGSAGFLCGGTATIANTDIAGKKLMRYYGSQMTLVDCINIDYSKITNHSPKTVDLHVRIKYNVNIHIIDKDNNDVQGVGIILTDSFGVETFNATTDASGKISELVMVYDKWWEYPSWTLHEDDYNDFDLKIKNGGKKYVMGKFTIDTPIDWTLQLQSGGSINKSFSRNIKL